MKNYASTSDYAQLSHFEQAEFLGYEFWKDRCNDLAKQISILENDLAYMTKQRDYFQDSLDELREYLYTSSKKVL
jgi:hypothetical protein